MPHIADYKKKIVNDFVSLMEKYPIVGIVDMQNLPSAQLQKMRQELRGKMELCMTKRRLMKIVLSQVKDKKPGIEKLADHMGGMPAVLFTSENPFSLARVLQQNKSKAPAKAGQIAPNDVVVDAGKTPFSPGPVISELSQVGLKTGVEEGKVVIKEQKTIVKAGEVIKDNIANVLAKLGIMPMEIGLNLVAVYEKGLIYAKDVLSINIKDVLCKITTAYGSAFNLAFECSYPTGETVEELFRKAHHDAIAVAIDGVIFDTGIIEILLARANAHVMGLGVNV